MSSDPSQALARAAVGTLGIAVCAGLLLAGAAAAGPAVEGSATADDIRVQAVSYADLDISSPRGRATLDRRIRLAARSVCDIHFFGSADQWLRLAERRCYDDAVEHARPYAAGEAKRSSASSTSRLVSSRVGIARARETAGPAHDAEKSLD